MTEIRVRTSKRVEVVNITEQIKKMVESGQGALVHIYTPHTTCGITINEDADPDVMRDIIDALERIVPADHPYGHREGNSDAHIKATLTGSSVTVPYIKGKPALGTWQGIFLMEFDGPRERKVIITLI
ncbi:MAG TPA: secondary thiamine-phosphate synthase enzyme YjbQ [Syntrophorhabdaceae bacterium]|nr:secondary thiamine-phosphate synthase enzyme YjbQ [Syntrophorhabdaceae bacterium]HQM82281.1 secondary thiamine-phosphate synthase enzyme YjbQ [Syntrophorhabdaceae bacterium]